MLTDDTPKTLQEAIIYYADPDRCQDMLTAVRWPNGVACPHCGNLEVTYLAKQRRWKCRTKHPRRQFSVKVGTIFEESPVGLPKWFTAIWLIAGAKNGISSYELHRAIGVTQKTAWFMLHRIRLAMKTGSFGKMSGEVEADETLIGGKARFMHKTRKAKVLALGKTVVMGLLERHTPETGHSTVKTAVVPSRKKYQLMAEVQDAVHDGSTVYTDELASYEGLDRQYVHDVINHAETYVRGRVHTNGLENFWSLVKRALGGTYVSVEPFHLHRYLDEEAYRFNNRKQNDAQRFAGVVAAVEGRRVTFAELTGANSLPA